MIRIGDFARLTGVSVVTLRHYDEEGLLKPCFVHPDSGYRYFQARQLEAVRRIRLLKELGFTLPEIRAILEDAPQPDDMRRMLMEKRTQAESRATAASQQIRQIDHFLTSVGKEYSMPLLKVERKTVPPLTVAAIHLRIPINDQVPKLLGDAYCRLAGEAGLGRLEQTGPCMAIWYSSPKDLTDETVDAAIPIDPARGADDASLVSVLPQVDTISAMHRGPFSEFQQCHVVLSEWLAEHGFRLDGPYREIYHEHGEIESTTEVQYPIAPE